MTAAAMQAKAPPSSADLPPEHLVLGHASTENFPVASRLLPAAVRADLMALYGWARLVDELGDNYAGDRLAALDEVERQLRVALGESGQGWAGDSFATHAVVARTAEMVRRRHLASQPLYDLAQANRQDQLVKRYETFADLAGYCRLSANPVGRMVLGIFGQATPERAGWSDDICTGLQLVEHWQDVAEDAIVGRVYIPQEDMRRFAVSEHELTPPRADYVDRRRPRAPGGASPACRALMAFQAARARGLLVAGSPLVASLGGQLRFAVAGFVAGGHAALDALAALDFDIYADTARPTRRHFVQHLLTLLALANRRSGGER
ncbi:MAG TPA: squalene synthase HpnC [Acidimicrobiales bacterium]|nr:squalene synthase HpnC [Acidimicrobiales bacterium]